MKKNVISFLFLCCFSAAYAQDSVLVNKVQSLTLENYKLSQTSENLQKQVKKLQQDSIKLQGQIKKLEKDIGELNNKINVLSKDKLKTERDGLQKANDSLQKQVIKPQLDSISKLKEQIKKLDKDKADLSNNLNNKIKELESSVDKLSKDKLKTERDDLQKQNKTLNEEKTKLEKKNSEQEKEIATLKNKISEQKNVSEQIVQTYSKPFDELVKSLTKQIVERDLLLLGNNEPAKKKIQDLQKYFAAKQILEERYNEEKIKNAQSQLKTIEQSKSVKDLTDKLGDYKQYNDALKNKIDKIIEIDKVNVSYGESSRKSKLQDILIELSGYVYNYISNFDDYPYLSKIVLEIMELKQKDVDKEIKYLLGRL